MTGLKGSAWIFLTAALAPALMGEAHCPGNVASVPLHLVNSYQMIVAVTINHSGPYDFLLDTGAQFTMIDPSLVAELHLGTKGSVPVAGTGFQTTSSVVQLDRLEVGPYAVAKLAALEFNVQNIRPYNPSVRGILGEDFLLQFDMLIDNAHRVLCLDDSTVLRAELKGSRIALETASQTESVAPNSLIFAVRLSDGTRPIRLKLDSGANAAVLYSASQFKPIGPIHGSFGSFVARQRGERIANSLHCPSAAGRDDRTPAIDQYSLFRARRRQGYSEAIGLRRPASPEALSPRLYLPCRAVLPSWKPVRTTRAQPSGPMTNSATTTD